MKKLIAPIGRIIVSIDVESKNEHQLTKDIKIRLERNYNNLNKRYTMPVNATVIHSHYIPEGSEILVHHNCIHDVNRIFNYKSLSGEIEASPVRYFSILENEAYLYCKPNSDKFLPCKGFATALRVFKPYTGIIQNIEPTLIKNKLYITSGELKGKVCDVLKASDYEIIYQGKDGKEKRVIRLRHWDNEELNEREEILNVDYYTTQQVISGELLVGLKPSNAHLLSFIV